LGVETTIFNSIKTAKMTREELLSTKEYWISAIQLDLYNKVRAYLDQHQLTQSQLAEQLNVTKGYISQVLNGDFDHKLSKLVELALASGHVPLVFFVDKETYLQHDQQDKSYTLVATDREGAATFPLVSEPSTAFVAESVVTLKKQDQKKGAQ
jgi:transcriptional regulator with XRE-family HTH domain